MKVAAKTIGFELVNTTPLAGPSGVLPYMDYVYSGSKQPYGATPAIVLYQTCRVSSAQASSERSCPNSCSTADSCTYNTEYLTLMSHPQAHPIQALSGGWRVRLDNTSTSLFSCDQGDRL